MTHAGLDRVAAAATFVAGAFRGAFLGSRRREPTAARVAANIDSGARPSGSEIPLVAKKSGRSANRQIAGSTPACDWDQWRPIKDVGDSAAY